MATFLSDTLLEASVDALEKWQELMGKHLSTAAEAVSKEEAQAALRKSLLRVDKQPDVSAVFPVKVTNILVLLISHVDAADCCI
jgi:hypothetical protein